MYEKLFSGLGEQLVNTTAKTQPVTTYLGVPNNVDVMEAAVRELYLRVIPTDGSWAVVDEDARVAITDLQRHEIWKLHQFIVNSKFDFYEQMYEDVLKGFENWRVGNSHKN